MTGIKTSALVLIIDGAYKTSQLQFLYEADSFDAMLNLHARNHHGTLTLFRDNILSHGSNKLNDNYPYNTLA